MNNESNWIIIDGEPLEKIKNNVIELISQCSEVLLVRGTVYYSDGTVCSGATVKVVSINEYGKETLLGCTFTDKYGKYSLSFKPISILTYKFIAYSPLKNKGKI